jgi:signal transduction histidine kinase
MDKLLDKAPCGFISMRDDGHIVRANAATAELLEEQSAEALSDRHIDSILTPGSRLFYQTQFFPLLKLRGKLDEVYLSLQTRTGQEVPILTSAIRVAEESFIHLAFLPMRRRRRFEDQIVAARKSAEQATEAKGRSLSVLSHELRTPIAAISGFADILSMGLRGTMNEAQLDDLRRIKAAAHYLLTLVNDLLSFTGLEVGKLSITPRSVSMEQALSAAESMLLARIEEAGLTYRRDHAGDLTALADPDRLQQILLNLLTNALKFTPRGGKITIMCHKSPGRVYINIADSGPGIPEDQRERIFDPFVQLDQQRVQHHKRGVGLGLSVSREIARAMQGDVTVDSKLGQGSVFTITLPEITPPG